MMFECKKQSVFLRKCAISFLLLMITFSLPAFCESHLSESPSFKYSREANENVENRELHSHIPELHGNAHTHGEPGIKNIKPIDMTEIWLYSVCSTLFISAVPFFLLFVIPLDNSDDMKPRLKVLLAFASGGLLGDAFLHLIPHATIPHHNHSSHENSHEHSHHASVSHDHVHNKDAIMTGLWVLGGIIAFLTVEKLVRLIKGEENSIHGHSHVTAKKKQETKKNNDDCDKKTNKKVKVKVKDHKIKKDEFATSGYLNLAADFTHNFTDGLAIGASFLAGNSIGIVTSITILLHEIPHEIGDFAILIKSGCSRRKAMLLQLVTAFGALAGNILALTGVGTDAGAAPWVLPFTAGGFIYIATVSVLPELLEESTKLGQSIKEICALLTGVILMVVIANFE